MFGLMDGFGNGTTTVATPPSHNSKVTFDTTNIIGLIVWLLCILYNCISSAVEVSKITHDSSEKRGKILSAYPCHYHHTFPQFSIFHSLIQSPPLTFHFSVAVKTKAKLILIN